MTRADPWSLEMRAFPTGLLKDRLTIDFSYSYCVQGPSSGAGARMAQARPAKTTANSKSTAQLKSTAQPKPTGTKKEARAVKYEVHQIQAKYL